MYCGKCGKEVADGSKFCPVCGASLQRPEAPEGGAVPPQAVKNAFEQRREAKARKKKGGIILGVVLAIVVVVGIAAIVLHFVGGSGGSKVPEYVCTDWTSGDEDVIAYIEYDENGKRTKMTQWIPDAALIVEIRVDEHGGQTKIKRYYTDGTIEYEEKYKNDYEFDKKGNPVEQTQYGEDGEIRNIYKYKYDKKGVLISEKCYSLDGDGKKILNFEIEYDEKGNDKKITSYDSNGDVTNIEKYENKYDKNGNLVKATVYYGDSKEEKFTVVFHNEKLSDYLKNKDDFDERAQEKIEESK